MKLFVLAVGFLYLLTYACGNEVATNVLEFSSFDILRFYAPISGNIKNEECRRQSLLYISELRKFTLWATQMFDASTKFPNGILVGSTYDLGNFDECIQIDVSISESERMQGKYCLTELKFERNLVGIVNIEEEAHSQNVSFWSHIHEFSNDPVKKSRNELNIAMCVPASCSANDVQTHLNEALGILKRELNIRAKAIVDPRMCQTQEPFSLSAGDIIMLCICLLSLGVLCSCTTYDLMTRMKTFQSYKFVDKVHNIILSFSAAANLKKLINHTPSEDGLDCIHGLKFMSICLVIMGHRIMFVLGSPIVNSDFIEGFYSKVEAMILLNGPIVVDTFFNISGFLVCYFLLHEFRKRKNLNFIMLYIHRLIRLTPVYAVVVAFYCTLFYKIGNGPLWAEKIGKEAERCRLSWWANLLYINNYVLPEKLCLIQSWYLSCDMHLFVVSPFIVYLLYKKPGVGKMVLLSLTAASLLTSFLVTYLGKLDALLLLYMNTLKDPISNPTFRGMYIPTHTRSTPYFIGMATGYLRYHVKHSKIVIPQFLVWFGWLLAIFCLEGTIFSAWIFYIPGRPYDALTSAFYGAFHRMVWSLGTSWLIFAMSTGNGAFVEPIFSWRPIITLSRLAYCAFLCHGGLQLYSIASMRTPYTGSIFNLVWLSLGDITLSFILALALTLMFESPILQLEKLLLHSRKPKVDHKKDDNYHKRTSSWDGVVTVDSAAPGSFGSTLCT